MPNFKPKTNKNILIDEKSILTVDKTHNDMVKKMNKRLQKLPKLKEKVKQLEMKMGRNHHIEKKLDIQDTIITLKREIKEIKKEKKNYFLDNSKYLFNYFENKKNISQDNNKKKIVHNFFKRQDSHDSFKEENENQQNLNIKQYLININQNNIDMNDYIQTNTYFCKVCQKGELIPVDYDGVCVCNICGNQTLYLMESDKPSYKEPPKEVCFYAYKRINHFREILAQFQAKESTQIESEVLDNIKKQIKKERIQLCQLTNDKTKQILKNLGYNKYYEHIPFIKHKLGIKPPTMSIDLENILCNLFLEIQKPYAKFCPNERVNFLNYYYVLYKLCELLDEDSYLEHFYMLKDPVKRMEQDDIWKKICNELNWEFIPTP